MQKIAHLLLEKQAVVINTEKFFEWSSGLLSPIYCDNRRLLSYPDARQIITEAFVEEIKRLGYDANCIAGVATGAIAWAALIADKLNLPMVYVRTAPKKHGLANQVEGVLPHNPKVLVIEDLISTGNSSLKACDALIQLNANLLAVISIFQYGFPSALQLFEQYQLPFHSLTHFDELFHAMNLPHEQQKLIQQWIQNPQIFTK